MAIGGSLKPDARHANTSGGAEERYGADEEPPNPTDLRSPFEHDIDRVIYAPTFRALTGKTQVVSVSERGGFHNRLTHSLKVAQLGRRIAERFNAQAAFEVNPNPAIVEAACLIHDIGHPPFGHAGEQSLHTEHRRIADEIGGPSSGFQGNAQNLRIVSRVEQRAGSGDGLQLTRAVMDAATKYPWTQGQQGITSHDSTRYWGVYEEEAEVLAWLMDGRPAWAVNPDLRPVEEQIMDWADDVTYAAHDLEDFYKAGMIPLASLFGEVRHTEVLDRYQNYLVKNLKLDLHQDDIENLSNLLRPIPYSDDAKCRRHAARTTSAIISDLTSRISLSLVEDGDGRATGYGARLKVPEEDQRVSQLLKALIWCFVIDDPRLASQQVGYARVVADLLRWTFEEHQRLLPPAFKDLLNEGQPVLRVCTDFVASLEESRALSLHRRLAGLDAGLVQDWVY